MKNFNEVKQSRYNIIKRHIEYAKCIVNLVFFSLYQHITRIHTHVIFGSLLSSHLKVSTDTIGGYYKRDRINTKGSPRSLKYSSSSFLVYLSIIQNWNFIFFVLKNLLYFAYLYIFTACRILMMR